MVCRQSILDDIISNIDNSYHPLIIGPRQIGKTTIAFQLIEELQSRNGSKDAIVFIEMSALSGATEENMINHLHQAFLNEKNNSSPWYQKVIEMAKPHSLKTACEFSEFLDQIRKKLDDLKRIILIIDETDILDDILLYKLLNIFRYQATEQLYNKFFLEFSFVLLAHKNLTTFDLGKGSPYNINVKTIRIPNFTQDEMNILFDPSHAGKLIGDMFTKDAIQFVFHETNGHPYLIQSLCKESVGIALENDTKKIDKEMVTLAALKLFEEGDRNLRIIMNQIKENKEYQEIIFDLLKGLPIPFERTLLEIRELEELGIIEENKGKRHCNFRTHLYRRVFVKEYFMQLTRLSGKYLPEDATLLLRISELQNILVNDVINKRITLPDVKNLKEIENELFKQEELFDIDVIKACLKYWNAKIDINTINKENIIKILALLFLEKTELE
jgi:Cdc6-like AAA superfamily ATPase